MSHTTRIHYKGALRAGEVVTLEREAAHHVVRVLRLRAGDAVTLFNGEGGEHAATLARTDARSVDAIVGRHDPVEREAVISITLLQALASGERMDYVLQKAVELGVDAFRPLHSARSIGRLDPERAHKRRAHWQQIAVASCEQCGRNRIPVVHALESFAMALAQARPDAARIVLVPGAGAALGALPAPPGRIDLLVGPEGGFDERELEAAVQAGFTPARLGPRVLRTETAAGAAIAAMHAWWGDFRAAP